MQLQAFVAGDAQLLLDDVDTGDHFGHRVLYLYTGIHLDEVEPFIFVQEFEGAGTPVIDFLAGVDATLGHFIFQVLGNARRRGFFHHLLVTTLQGTVPVAQMDGMAGAIRQDLHFHVTGFLQELFHVNGGVTEGILGFRAGQGDGIEQVLGVFHHAHATAAAAGSGLDDHRVADLLGHGQGGIAVVTQGAIGAGHGGNTGFLHGFNGSDLVAHQTDGLRLGADKGEAGAFHAFGKIRIFGEETVTRVNGVGVGDFRRTDDRRDVQVGLGGRGRADADRFVGQPYVHQIPVSLGINRHGANAQLLAGTQDAQGDFAAVGNDNLFQHEMPPLNDGEQRLIEFNRFAVFHKDGINGAGLVRFDLVHHLHGFDDAQHVAGLDLLAHLDKGGGAR